MQISQIQDPNVYAQQYATKNGISLDEAKSQLKAKYGDPSQQGNPSLGGLTSDTFTSSTSNIDVLLDNMNDDKSSFVEFLKGLIEKLKGTSESTQTNDKKTSTNKSTKKSTNKSTKKTTNKSTKKTTNKSTSLNKKTGNPPAPQGAPSAHRVEADNEVINYAQHHNCSLKEARKALKEIWGDPQ